MNVKTPEEGADIRPRQQPSAEQFAMLADALPTLCWMADPDGWIYWYNRKWYEYTGTTLEQMVGWGWKAVHDPALLKTVLERWTTAITAGEPFDMVFPLKGADGVFRPFLTRASPEKDESGKVLGWCGLNIDISAQQAAETALRESEERFRVAADSSPAFMWMSDDQARIVFANRRYKTFFGVETDDMLGDGWRAIVHPDDVEAFHEGFREAFAARTPVQLRVRVIHPSLGERWLNCNGNPRFDSAGDFLGYVGVNIDITDSVTFETALREESGRLEALNRAGAALTGETDTIRVVQAVTDAGVELTGARFGAFFYNVLNEQGESYMLYALSGVDRSAFDKFPMPRNTGIFGPTFRGEVIVRSGDITRDPRYGQNTPHRGMPEGHLPVRSYLAVPVTSRSGEVLGGLLFGHPEPDRFTDRHEELTVGIASQAAIAIDHARLVESLQRELAERRRAEDELRDSERRLRMIVHASPFPMMLHAEDGEVLELSRKWTELTGYGPEQIRTHFDWLSLAYPGSVPGIEQRVADEFEAEGETDAGEFEIRTRDGSTRVWDFHNVRVGRLPDGRRIQVSAVADVTERKRWEEQLQDEKERLRLIVESAEDFAIITFDPDGIITGWNSGARHILGYAKDEAIGQHACLFFTEEDVRSRRAETEMEIAARVGRAEDERWHVRKDGCRIWASGLMVPLSKSGERGFLKIFRDMTERKEAEEHKSLMIDELNHRVKNTLATVQAIATQALKGASAGEVVREALESRLLALSRSHDLLTREHWVGANLHDVVQQALEAFHPGDTDRSPFEVAGMPFRVRPKASLALGMALHELATNAAKYGALSVPAGRVHVSWTLDQVKNSNHLRLIWVERGGPQVEPPSRRGFGARLIERGLAHELGGKVRLEFAPAGVICAIEMDTDRVGGSA